MTGNVSKIELVKKIINEISKTSEEAMVQLISLIKFVSYGKGERFIKINQKNQSEYIVLSGYCRSYLTNPEGEEISLSFYQSGTVLPPHIIRTKNDKSLLNFQALTNVEMAEFDSAYFLQLMINYLDIRNFGNTVLKNELEKKVSKEISLVSLPAKDRLIQFRNEFDQLENIIPHPIIASYLGITNVSLSRLRHELSQK